MIKIARRGNYAGRNKDRENTSTYIDEAISKGYDVMVDVWLVGNRWYLGHHFPKEEIQLNFLERPAIWTHAMDLKGYVSLFNNPKVHTFWINNDDMTYTSKNIKWTRLSHTSHDGIIYIRHPNEALIRYTESTKLLGICTDNFFDNHQTTA